MEIESSPLIRLELRERVAIVSINRPEKRNALNLEVKYALGEAIRSLEIDESIFAIILTGAGGNFAAGTDLAEMVDMRPTDHLRLKTDEIFHVIRRCSKPVIAAVEGYALGGGCELAMACDIVVAAENANFGQPEIRVGVMPGAGGTQHLLRAAGRHKALFWALTGDLIPARDAFSANLVSKLAGPGEALECSIQIAQLISEMPPIAVKSIRDAIHLGGDTSISTALSLERRLFERLFDTDDQKEGMKAFLEKRRPHYTGT